MKTLLRILALVGLLASLPLRAAEPAEDPVHQELRALRDQVMAAINSGDSAAVEKHLHTNVVITWHNAETSRRPEGVRAYNDRVMKGPGKLVESYRCELKVDELTILHGGDTGIAFGSTDELFQLVGGKQLKIAGRWSATVVKEGGQWLIANLHVSTNLFDNPLLAMSRKVAWGLGIGGTAIGLVVGVIIGRRTAKS